MKIQKAFRLDEQLAKRLDEVSYIEGRTQTWYVSTALKEYFDKITGIVSVSDKKPAVKKSVDTVVDSIDYSILNLDHFHLDEIKRIRTKNADSAKKAKMTQRIVNALSKELGRAYALGFTIDQILDEWESRGWKSFKAEWMRPVKHHGHTIEQDSTRTRDQPISKQLTDNTWAN